MKWLLALSLFVVACQHDASDLAPNLRADVATWIGVDAACAECVAASCDVPGELCVNDGPCRAGVRQCSPPNPGCGQRTLLMRNMTACVTDLCYAACGLDTKKQLCAGSYEWIAPVMSGQVEFELRVRQYQGPAWEGIASVVPCSGPTPMCDEDLGVMLPPEGLLKARYNYSVTRSRPYFRVTGAGLRTMLFYEDGYVYPGTQLNIPLLPDNVYGFLASLLGTQVDDSKGTLDVTVFDCNGDQLDDVQLQLRRNGEVLTAAGFPYYFDDAIPKPAATYPQTSKLGQGGYVNLEPGLYDLTATVHGAPFGSIESVIVQPGMVTHVNLMPLSRDERP